MEARENIVHVKRGHVAVNVTENIVREKMHIQNCYETIRTLIHIKETEEKELMGLEITGTEEKRKRILVCKMNVRIGEVF